VDHNLHLTAKLAFDDRNLPDSENAMKAARGLVEYFTKSTQATKKLLKIQPNVDLPLRQGSTKPVKLLQQDVVTRWWSTYRMLKRLCELMPAIDALIIGDQKINVSSLTDDQKKILEEVEKALKPMADAQRILEGDTYPTISLVPFFLYKIRNTFQKYLDSPTTSASVRHLVKVLLADFTNNCYGDGLQILYSDVQIGHRRRYISLHPDVIIATSLDPRMKHLSPFVQSHEEKQEIWGLLLQKMEASFGEMQRQQRQQRQQTTTTTTTSTTTTRNASVPPTTGNNVSITSKANKTHDPFFNDDGDDADMYAEVHAAHDNHANQAQARPK
jgi:hypothetical protein